MPTFNNKEYSTWKDCCEDLLSADAWNVVRRRARKHSWPESIQHYLDNPEEIINKIVFNDKEYRSWKDCCKDILPHISYSAIGMRAQKSSWPQAIRHYLNKEAINLNK